MAHEMVNAMTQKLGDSRINWVDYAKGVCIILVVLMHSTLGVEKAAGTVSWLHGFITWAKPFRMPDFFLISGLFLAMRVNRPWREYFDSKVLHFAYFYILWMSIQFAFKAYGLYLSAGATRVLQDYALGFVEPFGTLWFIYMLAVFFVVAKLTRNVPPLFVFAVAAVLEFAGIQSGYLVVDEFAARFVYFFAGYWLASNVFYFAAKVNELPAPTIFSWLVIWGFFNSFMVYKGFAQLPGISLPMGFIGAGAVISTGVLLSKLNFAKPIRYAGENSIVIYLAFFLFMALTRSLLLKFELISNLSVVALLTTAAGIGGSVMLFWFTRNNKLDFLFRRPAWAKLAPQLGRSEFKLNRKFKQSSALTIAE